MDDSVDPPTLHRYGPWTGRISGVDVDDSFNDERGGNRASVHPRLRRRLDHRHDGDRVDDQCAGHLFAFDQSAAFRGGTRFGQYRQRLSGNMDVGQVGVVGRRRMSLSLWISTYIVDWQRRVPSIT